MAVSALSTPRSPASGSLPRLAASRAVLAVQHNGRSLATVLPQCLNQLQHSQERALAQHLAFGSLRWWWRLDGLLRETMQQPLRARDADLQALLIVSVYQLLYTAVPHYAAIAITTQLIAKGRKSWALGLANAVLNRISRSAEELLAIVDKSPECRWSHPRWLLDRLRDDWPDDWRRIVAANNIKAPMSLRVHRGCGGIDAYQRRLQLLGMRSCTVAYAPDALILEEACSATELPGFAEGWVSIQDTAAQLACDLLAPQPGDRVLDACAAPGGKTAHLLEREPRIAELLAVEVSAERIPLLEQTLHRLRLKATVVHGDATCPQQWWHKKPLQRILLDAPCSATGVIRRWPDIKHHRRADDLAALTEQQQRLLEALWPLLSLGGILLYATCSLLDCENAALVGAFVARHRDAVVLPITADWGRAMRIGRQIVVGDDAMDGFYYALLQKRSQGASAA